MIVWSVLFELTRFELVMGMNCKCSLCAKYLISSWERMRGRHLYVPPHCVVLNVLATFASSVVRILMDPGVGCPTISVNVASPKVVFAIEVINWVCISRHFYFISISSFQRVFLDRILSFLSGVQHLDLGLGIGFLDQVLVFGRDGFGRARP